MWCISSNQHGHFITVMCIEMVVDIGLCGVFPVINMVISLQSHVCTDMVVGIGLCGVFPVINMVISLVMCVLTWLWVLVYVVYFQ